MPSRSRSRSANRKSHSDRKAAHSPSPSPSSHSSPSPNPPPPTHSQPPLPSPRRDQDHPAPNTKLFVTNIDSKKYTEQQLNRDLKLVFQPFGAIKEIVIKTKQGSNNSYCFVEYQTLESATKAVAALRGYSHKGKLLKVEFGRGERKVEDRKSDKCYVCHKEGHFARDCKYNRYPTTEDRRERYDDRGRERERDYRDRDSRRDRDYRDVDRGYRDRDYRDRDYDRRDHRRSRYSRSSSSSSRSHRKRHYRDDYRRRDSYRSRTPQRSGYSSKRH